MQSACHKLHKGISSTPTSTYANRQPSVACSALAFCDCTSPTGSQFTSPPTVSAWTNVGVTPPAFGRVACPHATASSPSGWSLRLTPWPARDCRPYRPGRRERPVPFTTFFFFGTASPDRSLTLAPPHPRSGTGRAPAGCAHLQRPPTAPGPRSARTHPARAPRQGPALG